jgi:hypothetical protein
MPLLAGRTVLITAVKVGDKTLRANGSSFSDQKWRDRPFPAALEALPAEITTVDCIWGRPCVC